MLPRCDPGLPLYTQNGTGITGIVFERPPARDVLSSTIFNNSKNLASSSQELRPDTTGTVRRGESENRWIHQFLHTTSKVEVAC